MPRIAPLVRRAPTRLLRSGLLGVLLIGASALLAGLLASGQLFAASTSQAALDHRFATIPPAAEIAARPMVRATYAGNAVAGALDQLRQEVDRLPGMTGGVASTSGAAWHLAPNHPEPFIAVGPNLAGRPRPTQTAILYSRDNGVAQLMAANPTTSAGGDGVWISSISAEELAVRPGDQVRFGMKDPLTPDRPKEVSLRIAGIYRTAPDGRTPADTNWAIGARDLPGDPVDAGLTARLVVADAATFARVERAIGDIPLWTYDVTLAANARTPAALARAAKAEQQLAVAAAEPGSRVFNLLGATDAFQVASGLPQLSFDSAADARAAREQGHGVALAGGILGFVAVLTALQAMTNRRRSELELLVGAARPRLLLGTAALELIPVAIVGAIAGWLAAVAISSRYGPHPGVIGSAVTNAGVAAALGALVVIVSGAGVVGVHAWAAARGLAGRKVPSPQATLLPALVGAGALAILVVLTRPPGRTFADPVTAVVPILFITAGALLLVGTGSAVARSRSAARRAGSSGAAPELRADTDRLVLIGLRRTGLAVTDLAVVLAIGTGVLVYGLSSAASVREAVQDKAAVAAGARSSAQIGSSYRLTHHAGPSVTLPTGWALTWRTVVTMSPNSQQVTLIAVDPTTFARAASWGAGRALQPARAALSAFPTPIARNKLPPPDPFTGQIPVYPALTAIAVGALDRPIGSTAAVTTIDHTVPVRMARQVKAFPGATGSGLTLVVDARSLFQVLGPEDPTTEPSPGNASSTSPEFETRVIADEPLADLDRALTARNVAVLARDSLVREASAPALLSARWAATYQEFLGMLGAAMAAIALGLAVDRRVARAAPIDLLLRRFGLSARHLLRLRFVELLLLAGLAAIVVTLPLGALIAVLPRLVEPEPGIAPSLTPQLPWTSLAAGVAFLAVAVALSTGAAARRSAALVPGEVLRDGT